MDVRTTEERRKYKRFNAFLDLKLSSEALSSDVVTAQTSNLSRDGMKLACDRVIPTGTVVDLQIDIPKEGRPIHAAAKVMWVNSQENDGATQAEHGVRFLMIDPIDKFRLLDHAYNKWLENKISSFVAQ